MDMNKKKKLTAIAAVIALCMAMTIGCGKKAPADSQMPAESRLSAESSVSAGTMATEQNQNEGGYEEKTVQIFQGELTDRTTTLRFYDEAPHVAYMGIREYFDLMLGGGLNVEEQGDGRYLLTNAAGAQAEVDTAKGVVSANDMPAFENYLEKAGEGERSSFKDSEAPYLRLRELVYLDAPERVEMDLGGCGITLYGEKDEVYFPVSVLTTWLTDIAQNTVSYNGRYLYVCCPKTGSEQDRSYYHTEYYDGIVSGKPRESDLAAASYAELCFIFRYMYGYPGTAALDTGILREKGLDEALTAYGEEGAKYREELISEDFRRFWMGMHHLSSVLLDDGHNSTQLTMDLGDPESFDRQKYFLEFVWESFANETTGGTSARLFNTAGRIMMLRPESFERECYYQFGDTAMIYLNAFYVDEEGWTSYYENGGPLPEDTMGTVAGGLKRAAEDGGIRNIVFDVSSNLGGNSDAVMGILSLMTGKDYLTGFNELSKQNFRVYFDVDRNLDGVFDEKDSDIRYDFNYAALTSGASFSCGNLFPFLVREAGGMLIGDRTGGGCCSVQKAVLSEGFDIRISGYKFKLCDDEGSNLESGAEADVQLLTETITETNEFTGEEMASPDYSVYADLDGICRQVSEWYSE